jgi:hypothetical protein
MFKVILGILFIFSWVVFAIMKKKQDTPLARAKEKLQEVRKAKKVWGIRREIADESLELKGIQKTIEEEESKV